MSSATSSHIVWPEKDVAALFKAMELGRRYLNYDMGHALKAAARFVINSLGASTKVSTKFREIKDATWLAEDSWMRKQRRRDLLAFDVTGYFGFPRKLQTKQVYSRDMATAKRIHATIGRRGLARATWGAAWKHLSGTRSIAAAAGSHVAQLAGRYSDAESRLTGDDLHISITNFLPYAEDALEGGPRDVSTAMERAARGMEASIERQLVKRMGLGKLSR